MLVMFFFYFVQAQMSSDEDKDAPFMSRPLCVYRGHVSDVLDVSWSKVIVISIISYKISFIWITDLVFVIL